MWNEMQLQEQNLISKYAKQNMINQEKGGNIESQQIQIKESDRILFENNQKVISQPEKKVIQYSDEQQLMDKQVEFKLFDDSTKQSSQCYDIAFDKSGLIMISCCIKQIKIWNFEKGKLNLQNSYETHQKAITCLVYSSKKNSFISGCWQQIIKRSVSFHNLTNNIMKLLIVQYQINKRINLYQEEVILKQQIGWQILQRMSWFSYIPQINIPTLFIHQVLINLKLYWHQVGTENLQFGKKDQRIKAAGYKIHFINDQQIFWLPMNHYINELLVFELQNGDFSNNQNKTITFIRNYESQDKTYFPIMHNKDRNVRLTRHKQHIYLIREFNDGTFKIVSTLNCQSQEIYGTMTNNGQYLVFHDYKSGKYSSYEIIYQ
ncbi:unnamed protein product [Paramecium octaurelia]|uniref:WD40-repeat-containing domain n=1 Tax=Paramecium octaurelia TaxID=43137 RepID=A0A8S1YP74_PAROT|nr:unnamed protein product [Paramecium octaurelia]